jgi:D-xylonolactonase
LALLINDMIAAPGGGVYFGTVYWGASGMERPGKLYYLSPGGVLTVADEKIEVANGLAFSPDGRTLYFADSATRRIYAYDADPSTGAVSNRRIVIQFAKEDGLPDGLTADSAGNLWTALWYTGQVVRLTPGGKIERRIQLPCLQTSSLAFGGEGYGELYVTSAAEAWPSELAPHGYRGDAANQGGALYRLIVGSTGKPEFIATLGV